MVSDSAATFLPLDWFPSSLIVIDHIGIGHEEMDGTNLELIFSAPASVRDQACAQWVGLSRSENP